MKEQKTLSLFQVDAFTDRPFHGNPAAVIPLHGPLTDTLMQSIAAENNLSETVFVSSRPAPGHYDLRWFTPTVEVELCGHATLATAHVLFNELGVEQPVLHFHTRSGELPVSKRDGGWLVMRLPRQTATVCDAPANVAAALNIQPEKWLSGANYMAVYDSEQQIQQLQPDMRRLSDVRDRGLICTALSDAADTDFVSRFFAPNFGIDEDPVTGSAHCMLVPYWANRLGQQKLMARQISARGGQLACRLLDKQVEVAGQAVTYFRDAQIVAG